MAGGDRISVLPLEIKISLLSRLKFKDAVRTSALAHSWRHLWTLLPRLSLSSCSHPLGLARSSPDIYFDAIWLQRVHDLVSSLQGPILDFQLAFCYGADTESDMTPLLCCLLDLLLRKGGVETLHLQNFNHRRLAVTCLPSFHALKELDLCNCHLVLPTGFCGFNRLTKLDLLDTLISSSHDLRLPVNLSFPLLRHLIFTFTNFEMVSQISAPCLEKACIFHCDLCNFTSQKLAQVTLGLVTSVSTVSSLTLGFNALEFFSLVALPFNFTFPRLRFLRFNLNVDTVDKRMYGAFHWLLRSVPFLEELKIWLEGDDSSQTNGVAILMRELLPKKNGGFACLDRTMRSVTMSMDKLKVTTSITMTQFFLLNAKVLKELKIAYWSGGEVPSMIEELQKVEIVSSDAKVVIFDCMKKKNYFVYEQLT
ncbi:F-box protein-like protein [Rhynchospora pubera]|uniref:F-box protein-like protein n=1 Tax=Rhynchospora pubera TaxID=906938 RepID=A0AAV8BZS2_9POAL|nr:F-box protein-like protein [Rhynchospora pubera]